MTTITLKNGWTTDVQTRFKNDYTGDIIFGWDEDGDDPQELWDDEGELILLLNPETNCDGGMCDQHHFYKELGALIGDIAKEVDACEGYHIISKKKISKLTGNTDLDSAKEFVINRLASAGITKTFN